MVAEKASRKFEVKGEIHVTQRARLILHQVSLGPAYHVG